MTADYIFAILAIFSTFFVTYSYAVIIRTYTGNSDIAVAHRQAYRNIKIFGNLYLLCAAFWFIMLKVLACIALTHQGQYYLVFVIFMEHFAVRFVVLGHEVARLFNKNLVK
jgi:hypothetical protein